MICRVCKADFTGETCLVGGVHNKASGYPERYSIIVSCPCCKGSRALVMWQSEQEAVEARRSELHREVLDALSEFRLQGGDYWETRRLERREEELAYAE